MASDGTTYECLPESVEPIEVESEQWSSRLSDRATENLELSRRQFLREKSLPYLPESGIVPPWAKPVVVGPHTIKRTIEQFEYLLAMGLLPAATAQFISSSGVLDEYRVALAEVESFVRTTGYEGANLEPREDLALFFGTFGRALHMHPGGASDRVPVGLSKPLVF